MIDDLRHYRAPEPEADADWFVWLATLAALVAALMITGCASMEQSVADHERMHCAGFQHQDEPAHGAPFRYEWVKTREASAQPWVYLYVADVDFACRIAGADPHRRLKRIYGCAIWRPVGCTIYLQE